MAGYIGTQPVPQATQKRQAFTATAGQTTFATSGYSVGFVDVYMNGVKLAAADYTATNGSDVVLATAALANDIIEIVAFTSFVASGGLAAVNNLSDVASASTALTNLGVTSTAAELNTLDAVPRGSIIYGNSSAATARLSKGATGTVLTAGADDISWVAASGGGEQTFTASGSISAGALVGLNNNGTISTMGATAGSPVRFSGDMSSSRGDYNATVYDTANNKIIQFYRDTNNSNYLTCIVGTVSGTSISYGTPVALSATSQKMRATYDTNSSRAVCVYSDDNQSDDGYAVVVSVSGTTPTFGSAVEFSTVNCLTLDCCFDSNSNKVVVAYKASDQGRSKVGTVSGTSISFGSEATFTTNNPKDGFIDCRFDSNLNKVVIAYTDYSNSDYGTAIVGTVSGTSISFGSAVVYSNSGTTFYNKLAFDSNTNKFLFVYARSTELFTRVGTVSGTSISFGTEQSLTQAGGDLRSAAVFDSSTNEIILVIEAATTNFATVIKGSISGTSFFAGVATVVAEINIVVGGIVYDEDTNQCIFSFQDDNNYDGKHVVFNSANPSWVGVAAESISNGASGKVTVIGGINTNQSGLVTGAVYGLPITATALTAGASNAIGVALSSSSLYINTGKL